MPIQKLDECTLFNPGSPAKVVIMGHIVELTVLQSKSTPKTTKLNSNQYAAKRRASVHACGQNDFSSILLGEIACPNLAIKPLGKAGIMQNFQISPEHKLLLTIREAAEYSNIGINKIDALLRAPNCPFVLFVGTKKLVKRKEFEQYISEHLVV